MWVIITLMTGIIGEEDEIIVGPFATKELAEEYIKRKGWQSHAFMGSFDVRICPLKAPD